MKTRPQLAAISGVRLFAILQLVLMHLIAHHRGVFGDKGIFAEAGPAVQKLLAASPTATGLFFILSGFILTYVYFDPATRALKVSGQKFFITRAARIFPLHIALMVFLGFWLVDRGEWRHWLVNAGLLQSLVPSTVNSWNVPAWAASAMIVFYSLYPLLLRTLAKLSLRSISLLFVGLLSFNLIACLVFLEQFNIHGDAARESIILWFYYSPAIWVAYFLSGMMLSLLLFDYRDRIPAFLQSHGFANLVFLAYLGGIYQVHQLPHVLMRHVVMLPLQVLLMLSLYYNRGLIGWLCSQRLVVKLATASFTVYLLHSPLMTIYLPLFRDAAGLSGAAIAGFFALLLAVSLLIERWFVEPIKKLIVDLIDDRSAAEPVGGFGRDGEPRGAASTGASPRPSPSC